jgi:hypothetical protein
VTKMAWSNTDLKLFGIVNFSQDENAKAANL